MLRILSIKNGCITVRNFLETIELSTFIIKSLKIKKPMVILTNEKLYDYSSKTETPTEQVQKSDTKVTTRPCKKNKQTHDYN